jgi:flavin reductase (DIM6/NTAB) family NADH-FMN oxidoreductase RutF
VTIVNLREFRNVVGRFATGVAVVTAYDEEEYGLTVNSFTSVSLEPPMILVCIDKGSNTHQHILKSARFAVNILSAQQEEISRLFARHELRAERFVGVTIKRKSKPPLLKDCLASLDCKVAAVYDGGDHTIFLGEVEAIHHGGAGTPLVFYNGKYATTEPILPEAADLGTRGPEPGYFPFTIPEG